MKTIFQLLFLLLSVCCTIDSVAQNQSLVEYVNPLVGTDSDYALSNGNTYPAIALPWGMNFWTPQTNKNGNGWGYMYDDVKIRGFKQTHQPSPWIGDYAAENTFVEKEYIGSLFIKEGTNTITLTLKDKPQKSGKNMLMVHRIYLEKK